MRGEFIEEIGRVIGTNRLGLVEKDIILHQLLLDFSKNDFFRMNFLFKGGTCLIKHYLGYYRFSEDIDFTWKKQGIFLGKSRKLLRKQLSEIIDELGGVFEHITTSRDMVFEYDKADKKFVELVGGGRITTFKIWYESDILGRESFIKVQVNFVEKLCFPHRTGEMRSLLSGKKSDELKFLYPEFYEEYSTGISLNLYDVKEILCEKIRSILTRRGVKARDFVDVYLILKKKNLTLEKVEQEVILKTSFMLRLYRRFRQNFAQKMQLLNSGEFFRWGEEKDLMILDLDEKEFYEFVSQSVVFLLRVGTEALSIASDTEE